jgi:hypothetical protein
MFLSKLKVIGVLCLGILLGGVAVGLPGLGDAPALQAASAPPAVPPPTPPDDPDPVDGKLLLDLEVQKELRLSPNQINRFQAVSRTVDANNAAKTKEIQALTQRIEELRRQIAKLQESINTEQTEANQIRRGIETERTQALAKAAADVLSMRALQRLREIQRQQRGLNELLNDPKVQRMLKLNDEQHKKIESIRLEETASWSNYVTSQRFLGFADHGVNQFAFSPDGRVLAAWMDSGTALRTNQRLLEVLTDAQRATLRQWVGDPYRSGGLQGLWDKRGTSKP